MCKFYLVLPDIKKLFILPIPIKCDNMGTNFDSQIFLFPVVNQGHLQLSRSSFQMFVIYLVRNSNHFHTFLSWVLPFAQHWRFNVTILLVNPVLTLLVIESSDWSLEKFPLNLPISSTTSLFTSDILLCNDLFCSSSDKTIGISSLFNSLSSDSSVYWGGGHDSYKVKVRLLCFKNKILHRRFNLTRPSLRWNTEDHDRGCYQMETSPLICYICWFLYDNVLRHERVKGATFHVSTDISLFSLKRGG